MKQLSFKIGSPPVRLGLGLALLALLLFSFSVGVADDLTNLEKLLLEESKPNDVAGKVDLTTPRSLVSTKPVETPAPSPGTPARTVTARPASRPTSTEVISDGWSTIQPNAPGIVVPEPRVVAPPPAAKPAFRESHPTPFAETEELKKPVELPAELTEPEAIKVESDLVLINPFESETFAPKGLFQEDGFDMLVEVIDEDSELGESGSGNETGGEFTRRFFSSIEELEAIAEPKKTNSESATPGSELSSILNDFANEKIDESESAGPKTGEASVLDNSADAPDNSQVTVPIPDFDSDDDETVYKLIDPSLVGDPHAQDKLQLMYDEVVNGLRTRNIANRYEMWKGFARKALRDTAGVNTGSELDGRCRLTWFQKLYAEPVRSTFEAEEYSRELFVGLSGGHRHLAELMPGIRERMDVPKREDAGIRFPLCTTPLEALNEVKRCLLIAASAHAKTFSTLTHTELAELDKNFVNTFIGPGCINGHTIPARSVGRRHVDILDKMDKAALYDAGEALIPLTNTALLDLLTQLPNDALPHVMMNGQRFQRLSTAAGDIIIGGRGKNTYDLDSPEMREVICVISFGEEDIYREGSCNMSRPVLAILALGKKNTFVGTKPGIQGGSIMGISLLVDRHGDSTYSATDVAQGSTMGGVGILINYEGNNTYIAQRRVQGHALLGLGMLIDRGTGNCSYKASLWAQGFGAPGGYGVISNAAGNNHYYCGGRYLDSYPEHPGYDGWGQGVGAGIRQVANGGIGIILSGEGDDIYEVDYFGHGGGYWLGVGIARDFGGNDQRHGTTLKTYDGRPRPASGSSGNGAQAQWTRFVNGFGCHYALGYCFDDGGDDLYGGRIMGTGMAWDLAYGALVDFSGSGRYTSIGNMTQGVGAEASIGILFSYGGDDTFAGRSHGLASGSVTYHPPSAGGNFSFLINYGGENKFGSGASNNSYVRRGTDAGFLIQRPTEREATHQVAALRQAIEARNQEIAEYDATVTRLREEAAAKRQRFSLPRHLAQRPKPISDGQLLSAVPDFDPNVRRAGLTGIRTSATETTVK